MMARVVSERVRAEADLGLALNKAISPKKSPSFITANRVTFLPIVKYISTWPLMMMYIALFSSPSLNINRPDGTETLLITIYIVGKWDTKLNPFSLDCRIKSPKMADMTDKPRDNSIDAIRGISMMGIILIHVHSYFAFFHGLEDLPVKITHILSNLSRFSVPVFVFSAGYFARPKSGKEFWRSRLTQVLLPYLVFCIIGALIHGRSESILGWVESVLLGEFFAPYYFIPLLFQFYFLYYLVGKSLVKSQNLRLGFLGFALILNLFSNLGFFDVLPNRFQPIWIGNFVFFFALGIAMGNLDPTHRFSLSRISAQIRAEKKTHDRANENATHLTPIIRLLFLLAIGFITWFTLDTKTDMTNHNLIYPCLAFLALQSFVYRDRMGTFLAYIGKNSMGIFLIHPIVIHFMHSIDPYELGGGLAAIPITLLINLLVPAIAWALLSFIFRRP